MNLIQLLTNENPTLIKNLVFLISIVESFLFYKFFCTILNIENSRKNRNIFLLVMTLACGLTILLPNNFVKDSITVLTFLLSIVFIFKQNVRNSFIALLGSYLCAFVTEYIAEHILTSVLNCEFDKIITTPLYYLLAIILSFVMFALVIYLINLIKYKNLLVRLKNISLKISIIINLILGIFAMVIISYLLSQYKKYIPFELILISIVTLILYFSISMYSILRTNILEKTQEDLQNEILYNRTLTLLHDNIRSFKHDFNNIVQSIGGYIALNDMNGLNKYYEKLLYECKLTNNLDLLNPETINNPSLYSLLTNKYYMAQQKNVNITFSIFIDLSNINFNMYELTRILGILLDNAIEAAEETTEKIVEVEFTSNTKKQMFIIKNSCKNSNISTTKIFEKGFSTKNRNSGIGLWKVHKILSKSKNMDLFTTVKNNTFSQQLEIFF